MSDDSDFEMPMDDENSSFEASPVAKKSKAKAPKAAKGKGKGKGK